MNGLVKELVIEGQRINYIEDNFAAIDGQWY